MTGNTGSAKETANRQGLVERVKNVSTAEAIIYVSAILIAALIIGVTAAEMGGT